MQLTCGLLSGFTIFFFTLSHKLYDVRKKNILNIKCVFRFSLQVITAILLILRRPEQDTVKILFWSSYKVPVILEVFYETSTFSIFEKYSYVKFHENPFSWSRGVPRGWTDITKLMVAFRNFAKLLKTYQDCNSNPD